MAGTTSSSVQQLYADIVADLVPSRIVRWL